LQQVLQLTNGEQLL